MSLVARKDNKKLAGLDDEEVDAKSSIVESLDLVETIESQYDDAYNSNRKKLQEKTDLKDIQTAIRQHVRGNVKPSSDVAKHCINHAFDDGEKFTKCEHRHEH